ncbi:hypothetical protein MP478_15425 [Chryseobacterium sp. WG14]|uniref:hypothetical protein n=1 Tax=Chryseobacterium sp. WG14 TaxID=2926909 RepID=UPI00211F2FD8|nr:hypothetical protein [Chryseobacterium sp. WG14]MCQ9640778.1 hypothetical protein [Chryseobacterium sp. WG14]
MEKNSITEKSSTESSIGEKVNDNRKQLSFFEKVILVLLLIAIAYAVYVFFTDSLYFDHLVEEDGFYEDLTSIFLFFTSFILLIKFFKYQGYYTLSWKISIVLMTVAFFFGGGEEISWGQRIFQIQSSDFFKLNNAQQETNLHNLVIGHVKLNKLVFSNMLSIGFGIYFLVLPIVWHRVPKIKKLIDKFGISIARPIHLLFFIIVTAIILLLINHSRKWEVWEFAFALTMFLIVYNPLNIKEIFSKENH